MDADERSPRKEIFSSRIFWGVIAVVVIITILVLTDGLRSRPPRPSARDSKTERTFPPVSAVWSSGSFTVAPAKEAANEYIPANFQPQPGQYYIFLGGVVVEAGLGLPVEDPVMTSAVVNDKIVIDAKLFRGEGIDPVEITANRFVSPANAWDLNYDGKTVEVVDEKQIPRLQVLSIEPRIVAIFGLLGDKKQADYLCLPHKILVKPPGDPVLALNGLKRIFQYPSAKYLGQRAPR